MYVCVCVCVCVCAFGGFEVGFLWLGVCGGGGEGGGGASKTCFVSVLKMLEFVFLDFTASLYSVEHMSMHLESIPSHCHSPDGPGQVYPAGPQSGGLPECLLHPALPSARQTPHPGRPMGHEQAANRRAQEHSPGVPRHSVHRQHGLPFVSPQGLRSLR